MASPNKYFISQPPLQLDVALWPSSSQWDIIRTILCDVITEKEHLPSPDPMTSSFPLAGMQIWSFESQQPS